jgi:hypothetical protein
MTEQLRSDLEPLPIRLKNLPVYRGYPVPWFVQWMENRDGRFPEFRAMDFNKFKLAIRMKLCWVCGEPLGRFMTFVAGPMCGINRTSAEPPCHLECAEWSARNCPFLSKPQMERRDGGMEGESAGHMIRRNPGVTLLWTTRGYSLFSDGAGGVLLQMGEPTSLQWFAMGKPATRAQVEESIRTGLPHLEALAEGQDGALAVLHKMRDAFFQYLPT